MNTQQLMNNTEETYLCVGIDPEFEKFPKVMQKIQKKSTAIEIFCKEVIDRTSDFVCAYKMQKAFFDFLPEGHEVMKSVIGYVHKTYPAIPVIIDCKIGDIDNTMKIYLKNIFQELKADGAVVNPYMGDDIFKELEPYPNKIIVVLAKTSNPTASIVQDIVTDNGQKLWERILDLSINRWNNNKNIVPVLSSLDNTTDYDKLRKIIPDDMPILLAGVGAQGGDMNIISKLLNSNSSGVIVNSSRGIMYNFTEKHWRVDVWNNAKKLMDELNKYRR